MPRGPTRSPRALCAVLAAMVPLAASASSWVLRPNLYFGAKTATAAPDMAGLMWFKSHSVDKLRHACADEDGLRRWGWQAFDGRGYGVHYAEDPVAGPLLRLNKTYVRTEDGGWALRVEGNGPVRGRSGVTSLLFYVASANSTLETETTGPSKDAAQAHQGGEATVRRFTVVAGGGEEVETARTSIRIVQSAPLPRKAWTATNAQRASAASSRRRKRGRLSPPDARDLLHPHTLALNVPGSDQWRAAELVQRDLHAAFVAASRGRHHAMVKAGVMKPGVPPPPPSRKDPVLPLLSDQEAGDANLAVIQLVVHPPFVVEVAHVEAGKEIEEAEGEEEEEGEWARKLGALQEEQLTARAQARGEAFEAKLRRIVKDYIADPALEGMVHFAVSNLLGGISHFRGASLVQDPSLPVPDRHPDGRPVSDEERKRAQARYGEEAELVTGVPSRSFFPRGFLWDEGFHQLLVHRWDPDLSITMVRSWLARMDSEGWIPREQILGAEAESKVPPQFQVQSPDVANPPALVLVVEHMLARLERAREEQATVSAEGDVAVTEAEGDGDAAATVLAFLREAFPRLRRWFQWLQRTQAGPVEHSFRWRGQTDDHCLPSGLDDYPRARPTSRGERHVDLHSWMVFFARTLARIAGAVGEGDEARSLEALGEKWMAALEERHWSEGHGFYFDYVVSPPLPTGEGGNMPARDGHVRHYGYVGLFPLFLRLLPASSPRLGHLLRRVLDEDTGLLSGHGLRSLAASDALYRRGEDYWRGAVWFNCNFLLLRALHTRYAREPGPNRELVQQVYDRVRAGLLRNMARVFRDTGHLWENYDADSGNGRGTHPFTGWSALIALVAGEQYE